MARSGVLALVVAGALVAAFPAAAHAAAAATGAAATAGRTLPATPALIREVQFLLTSLGFNPGPIDGIARQLTNGAVHKFDEKFGLPITDLVNNGTISAEFLDRLRHAAARVLLGTPKPPPAPSPSPAPSVAVAPPARPAPPPVDRFARCPYDPHDFLIGGTQYTPQTFLDTGFGGSTANAVATLKQRLREARRLAQQIGGPALQEVQRQARVLSYFVCRLKIEEASAGKN
jgi:peptidoglycan hydrolase-like protein with peptidoglycan-binding domain